jgi:hypothetical protein
MEQSYCGQGNVLGGTCYQRFYTSNYKYYSAPGNLNYATDALNMPVTMTNVSNQQDIDQLQGWSTLFTNFFTLQLEGGGRFYSSGSQDNEIENPTIGIV